VSCGFDAGDLAARGWARFPAEPATLAWAEAAIPHMRAALSDPALRARDLRCGGTWFVGANVLPNGPDGRLPGGPPLEGAAVDAALRCDRAGPVVWDRAQVSILFPGYPQRSPGERPAAHSIRRDRDGAHVDGLIADAAGRRRMAETHRFVLGIALDDPAPGAAPLVVWEGSHETMRGAFRDALAGADPRDWRAADVTEAYHAARRRCFETAPRRPLPLGRGEAVLVHRLCLHGVAPWTAAPDASPRAIAYFRPAPPPSAPPSFPLVAP
jgi:hypothetical protein